MVCICIPTFNAERTIRETLASILSQSYVNLDIHIVDNASTDETLKAVAEFEDSRITIHRNEVNIGGEGNFNRCIQLATGEYTAIYHADDLYEPEIVQCQVNFLEQHSDVGAVFTEANLIDDHGNKFGAIRMPKEISEPTSTYNFEQLFKVILYRRNIFVCPSAMVRTDIYKNEISCWRGDLFRSSADLDVWLRIAKLHLIGFLMEPLVNYRVSKYQFSASVRKQTEKSDFCLVVDHYLKQDENRNLLRDLDLMHYRWLERTDTVRRAINLFLRGSFVEANELCYGTISCDSMRSAIDNRLGALSLLAAIYIKLFIVLRVPTVGCFLLKLVI